MKLDTGRKSQVAAGIVVVVLGAGIALAGSFWVKKPYMEWNQKEVEKLLSASPWARPIPIQLKTEDAPDAKQFRAGVDAGSRFGVGNDTNYRKTTITIVWSGKTIRQAKVRQQRLKGQPADEEKDKEFIDGPDPESYVLVLAAPNFKPLEQATIEELKANAELQVGKKKISRIIRPDRVEKPEAAGGHVAVLFFPRGETPLTASDKRVTFDCAIGGYEVSHQFDLKAMQMDGALDL